MEKYKLISDKDNDNCLSHWWYTYRGMRIIQDKSIRSGYWGRWCVATSSKYEFTQGTWKELKKAIDQYLDQ